MNRRNFLILTSLSVALSQVSYAKGIEPKSAIVLETVYNHLFPKTSTMPNAKEFGAVEYLIKNINSSYFPKEDANLIIQGAIDFASSFDNFLTASQKEQSSMIDTASNNDYGYEWLSKLVYYGFEALLSDPIYGGNKNQVGWKSVQHKAGQPRPKKTYGRRV